MEAEGGAAAVELEALVAVTLTVAVVGERAPAAAAVLLLLLLVVVVTVVGVSGSDVEGPPPRLAGCCGFGVETFLAATGLAQQQGSSSTARWSSMAPCAGDRGTAPGAARTTSRDVAVAAVACFFFVFFCFLLRERERERAKNEA